jgi:hypothetical protein
MGFDQRLPFGKAAETAIGLYLRGRGFSVLPIYERTDDEKKGPQLYRSGRPLIAPDMLVYRRSDVYWIEAKHKTAFSWHRLSQSWVTGIDRRHYVDYLELLTESPWPVWLFFLHRGGQAKDSPGDSPAGLFGNDLSVLRDCVNHRHHGWGSSGMIYWAIGNLRLIAPLAELERLL